MRQTDTIKDRRYVNVYDENEIVLASKYYYDFCLDEYKRSIKSDGEEQCTCHPDEFSKEELIICGIDMLENDDEWILYKVVE